MTTKQYSGDGSTASTEVHVAPEILRILESPAFTELRARRGRFAAILTTLMLLIYYGFILAIAFAPHWLAIRIDGVITLGIPLGLGVILSAIVLTGVYVRRANGEFDALTVKAVRSANV
ncbi:DUF485 domain-containing protein [Nevskia ramosa]|uniref:DUF485 domain-containing protein n=1 Tax=Nevskia ramosa TaxID=64002 RepID=UPI0023E03621|nr:DUF485 domain-containing protein [Nevskia ramosa]